MKKKLKWVIKQITPPFIIIFYNYIKKITYKKNNISTIHEYIKTSNKVFVVGNGPSLKETFNKNFDLIKDLASNRQFDCIVVNNFALTEYYEKLRPNVYVFYDPVYFNEDIQKINGQTNLVKSLLDAIKKNTKWSLTVCVPDFAYNANFITDITKNENISIKYYNHDNMEKNYNTKSEYFKLLDLNQVPPPCMNVLNVSLYLALFWNYNEAYIMGADTSWFKNLYVDQKTNILYSDEQHFYGNKYVPLRRSDNPERYINIADKLENISKNFKYYDILEDYSKYKKLKVYNASSFSFITSFERFNLENFQINNNINLNDNNKNCTKL